MIERIQELKNIGTFKSADQIASCGFQKITVIYGGNSHGKSTVCDIIKLLCADDSKYIEERKTVGSTSSPKVKISFGNKRDATYLQGKWVISGDIPEIKNITVFDSEFIQKNVFTNSTIERRNKENFTEFILGSEGIAIQTELEILKAEKTKQDNEVSRLQSQIEREINIPFNDFLKVVYQENIDSEDVQCLGLQQQIINLQNDKKDIASIKALSLPKCLDFKDKLLSIYLSINKILSSSYSFSKSDIIERFNNHKKLFSVENIDFDIWISKGMRMQRSSICPYCGQSIADNQLVESYITLFCTEFIDYSKNIDSLSTIKYPDSGLSLFIKLLTDNSLKVDKLASKIYVENFDKILKAYRELEEILKKDVDIVDKIIADITNLFNEKIEQKLNNKYSSINTVNLHTFVDAIKKLEDDILLYNTLLKELNLISKGYLDSLSIVSLENKIKELQKELDRLTAIVKRNKYNDLIEKYKQHYQASLDLNKRSKTLKKDFDDAQSKFLETFFDDIDLYYKRLGSKNYKIEKATNAQGTKKVYTVKLFFRDKEIGSEKIQFVLSDSDKRALALSIFLAKLKHSTQIEKTIIVMDDPITSFDNERMGLFINIIKEFKNANQFIILTHYSDFYKKIAELTYAVQPAPSFLKIQYFSDSNKFITVSRETDELLMNDYERSLYKMWAFINGNTHDYSSTDARTLMQKWLEYKFYYEIKDRKINIGKFENFLDELHNQNLLNNDIYLRLDAKREEYNVTSHTFDVDPEDMKRKSIIDLQSLLQEI